MNDSLDDIAAELARLRPTRTSDGLNRRLEQDLGTAAIPTPKFVVEPWWFGWLPLAAAAALVVVVAVTVILRVKTPGQRVAHPATQGLTGAVAQKAGAPVLEPAFRRVSRAHYVLEAEDNGLIFTSDTTPWRKVRWQFLSASEWRDERDKTTFQVLIPREETMLIPVNVQ